MIDEVFFLLLEGVMITMIAVGVLVGVWPFARHVARWYDHEKRKKARKRKGGLKQDTVVVDFMPLDYLTKSIIKHYLLTRQFRYDKGTYVPFNESPLDSFLHQEERKSLLALLKHENESEDMLNWVIKDWTRFYELMKEMNELDKVWEALNTRDTEWRSIRLKKHFAETRHLISLIREICVPNMTPSTHEPVVVSSPSAAYAVRDEQDVVLNRFDELASGVSGVSYLKAPYTEMIELLEERDELMPDVIEKAEQTLRDIEGLIEERRHQDKVEKALRDHEHIQNIRRSAGLR